MAGKLYNRAKMSVTGNPGTGNVTLNAAVTNFLSFANSGVENGEITYLIEEGGTKHEVGNGVYDSSAGTITRSAGNVYASSAALISGVPQLESFTSACVVGITVAAEDLDFAFAMSVAR